MNRPKRVDIDALNSCEVESDLLIYTSERNALFSLNASARAVWALCDGRRTEAEICRLLAQDLGIPVENLASDVNQALLQLAEANLIHEGGAEETPLPVVD